MRNSGTREKIIKVALREFVERSYHEVSVEDIARKAGVSKGGLFYHFPSKYELAKEVLVRFFREMAEEVLPKVLELETPEDRFRALIDTSIEFIRTNPKLSRFFLEVYEEAIRRGNDLGQWREFYREYHELLEEIFERIGLPNPRQRAVLFAAMMDGLAMHYLIAGIDMDTLKEEIFRMFKCAKY